MVRFSPARESRGVVALVRLSPAREDRGVVALVRFSPAREGRGVVALVRFSPAREGRGAALASPARVLHRGFVLASVILKWLVPKLATELWKSN